MIKPIPSFKKCPRCGKLFLCAPKSDCISPANFICSRCRKPKGENKGLFEKISEIMSALKK